MAMIHYDDNGKPIIRDEWCIDDILSVADTMDITLTESMAEEVMCIVVHDYDCNHGINWSMIEHAIQQITQGA